MLAKITTILSHIGWRNKILGFSALYIFLILAIGGFGTYTIYQQNLTMEEIIHGAQQRVDVASTARLSIVELQLALAKVITANERRKIRIQAVAAIRSLSLLDEQIQILSTRLPKNNDVQQLSILIKKMRPVQMRVIKAGKKNQDETALGFMSKITEDSRAVDTISKALMENERVSLNQLQESSSDKMLTVMITMSVLLGIGLVIGIGASILAASLVTRPLNLIEQTMTAVSDGDLRVSVNQEGSDEIARTAQALSKTIENLHNLISTIQSEATVLGEHSTEIGDSAQTVRNVSDKLHDSVALIKNDTELVHSVTKDVAERITKVSEDTRQTSQSSNAAAEHLMSTVRDFERFQTEMEETAASTRKLSSAAEEINHITETIHNISSQTNLLALNAAIEAARAGDQGRGFAVVADEVRSLAKRTEDATTEISGLIEQISNSVQTAVVALETSVSDAKQNIEQLTRLAAQANDNSERVDEVQNAVLEIGNLMASQREAVQRINEAVSELFQVSGEASQETGNLNNLSLNLDTAATGLNKVIHRFSL